MADGWAQLIGKAADHTYGALMTGANMWYNSAMTEKNYHYASNLQNRLLKWQERMSNTAHQREVQDLIKAGINPLYTAIGGSGASTPSGTGGTVQNANYDLAGTMMNGVATLANVRNQTNATNADVAHKGMLTEDIKVGMLERLARIDKIRSEVKLNSKQEHYLDSQMRQVEHNIRNLDSLTTFNITNAKYLRGRTSLLGKPIEETYSHNEGKSLNIYGASANGGHSRTVRYGY